MEREDVGLSNNSGAGEGVSLDQSGNWLVLTTSGSSGTGVLGVKFPLSFDRVERKSPLTARGSTSSMSVSAISIVGNGLSAAATDARNCEVGALKLKLDASRRLSLNRPGRGSIGSFGALDSGVFGTSE